ncbi:LysE family transporter, partial [Candidatus Dependentiae bacterium]
MECLIYIKCFLVGMLASASLGPIFILTFNRGAVYGFTHGFATAIGACLADGLYFFLGLMGILSLLKSSENFMFWLDTLGGIV